jgi:hypothetical protein
MISNRTTGVIGNYVRIVLPAQEWDGIPIVPSL